MPHYDRFYFSFKILKNQLWKTRFIKRPSQAVLFWKDLLKYIPEYLLSSRSLAITIFPLPRRYRELEMAGTILRYRQYF